ncbi:hypothetical protein [Lawsonella clevelandensis]|uniref:hypothetical protein n=1 Tax=Lawsonella clevelandensis TaxID=1528099 RepID=UPI0023F483A1|nr:hypothetical protein [Lawsonella clevelandensis]MDU7193418.1 hypothetical protein [Lawsonella clevelandensis]
MSAYRAAGVCLHEEAGVGAAGEVLGVAGVGVAEAVLGGAGCLQDGEALGRMGVWVCI